MDKIKKIRWDANWGRLRLETKIDKLRERLNFCYDNSCQKASSASADASTALYVANLNR